MVRLWKKKETINGEDYYRFFRTEYNTGAGCHDVAWSNNTCAGTYTTEISSKYFEVDGKPIGTLPSLVAYNQEMEARLSELIQAERHIMLYNAPSTGPNGEPASNNPQEIKHWREEREKIRQLSGSYRKQLSSVAILQMSGNCTIKSQKQLLEDVLERNGLTKDEARTLMQLQFGWAQGHGRSEVDAALKDKQQQIKQEIQNIDVQIQTKKAQLAKEIEEKVAKELEAKAIEELKVKELGKTAEIKKPEKPQIKIVSTNAPKQSKQDPPSVLDKFEDESLYTTVYSGGKFTKQGLEQLVLKDYTKNIFGDEHDKGSIKVVSLKPEENDVLTWRVSYKQTIPTEHLHTLMEGNDTIVSFPPANNDGLLSPEQIKAAVAVLQSMSKPMPEHKDKLTVVAAMDFNLRDLITILQNADQINRSSEALTNKIYINFDKASLEAEATKTGAKDNDEYKILVQCINIHNENVESLTKGIEPTALQKLPMLPITTPTSAQKAVVLPTKNY